MLARRGTTLNLFGNLDYIQSGIDGYQETGAGSANLTITKRKQTRLTFAIKLRFVQAISMRNGVTVLQFDLTWKHAFKDQNNTIEGAFVSDPVNTRFSFDTKANETDYLNFSAGVQYLIPGGTTGFAHIQLDLFRENYKGGNMSVGIRSEF